MAFADASMAAHSEVHGLWEAVKRHSQQQVQSRLVLWTSDVYLQHLSILTGSDTAPAQVKSMLLRGDKPPAAAAAEVAEGRSAAFANPPGLNGLMTFMVRRISFLFLYAGHGASAGFAAYDLSLIHISEPTRPY